MEPNQREYSEKNLKALLKEENGKHRLNRDLEKWSKANSKQSKECRTSTRRCSREDDELYDRIKYLWPDVPRSVFDRFVSKLPRPPPPPSKDATAHAREIAQTRLLTQEYHSLIKDSNNWRLPTPPTTQRSLPHTFPSSARSTSSRRAASVSSSPLSARKNKKSVEVSLQETEKRLKSLQTENIRLTDNIAESQRENNNLREQLTELHMQLKEWRNSCECAGLNEQLCMATASYEALLGDFEAQKNQSQLQDAEVRRLEEEQNKARSQILRDSQRLQDEQDRSEKQRRDNVIEIERVNAEWGKELMTRVAAVNKIRFSLLDEASSLMSENERLREENIGT
ncbi:hypothetical protein CYLTODRAFT_257145 [Cylindrobasidium torrendii FP15055 ss-10]|uniref:Uncharacterized protein n=1 Tax=Cylindrobasidium torrendii FP15055 ss-10 TaxID=1314674 RepID=A0A0D7BSM8_9AGAR|nr:hypothetical protein CYLTODRAFT_257145 [Cylindrobasidium torrendii FP15055 ss-10]